MDVPKTELHSMIEALVHLLYEQEQAYLGLFTLEEQKQAAVIEQDVEALREVVRCQEDTLEKIDNLEQSRLELLKKLSQAFGKPMPSHISEILEWDLDQKEQDALIKQTVVLKELVLSLRNLSDTNTTMLLDQKSLFEDLIKNIAKQDVDDYEKSNGKSRPIFVDANC